MSYLYVPDMEASDSGLELQCQLLAPSVSWRGKLRAAPLWLRGCKRDLWLRHLFGQTSQPLTADPGVERWISSLRESRVSPGALQARRKDSRTSATLAKSSSVSLAKWDQATSSLRTSPGLFDSEPPIFSGDFPKSGSMRNGAFFQQAESAQLIEGNGSSCWPIGEAWPTPDASATARYNQGGANPGTPRPSLAEMGKMWPTPQAAAGGTSNNGSPRDGKRTEYATKGKPQLPMMAKMWPTATAGDSRASARGTTTTGVMHAGESLTDVMRNWPTPTARDHKGSPDPKNRDRMTGLLDEAAERLFPLVPTETGAESLKSTTRRLNPKFVEWLMGLPDGWTSSGCSATELSRYKRLMRSALYCNESTTSSKPDNPPTTP